MGTHPIFESDFDCLTEKKRMLSRLARQVTRVTPKRSYFYAGPGTNMSVWSLMKQTGAHGIEFWVLFAYCCWGSYMMLYQTVYATTIKKVEITTTPEGSKDYDAHSRGIDWNNPTAQRPFNPPKDAFWGTPAWKDELKALLEEIH